MAQDNSVYSAMYQEYNMSTNINTNLTNIIEDAINTAMLQAVGESDVFWAEQAQIIKELWGQMIPYTGDLMDIADPYGFAREDGATWEDQVAMVLPLAARQINRTYVSLPPGSGYQERALEGLARRSAWLVQKKIWPEGAMECGRKARYN